MVGAHALSSAQVTSGPRSRITPWSVQCTRSVEENAWNWVPDQLAKPSVVG